MANEQGRLKRILSGTSANPSSLQDLRYYNTSTWVAWYDGVGNTRYWLFGDHPSAALRTSLGSAAITAGSGWMKAGELKYRD